jgi:small-conductance mechanosensitive channel
MSTLDSWTRANKMSDEILKEITSTLHELLKWTKFSRSQQLQAILAQTLSSDEMKIVYELSDGNRGTRGIARIAKIWSHATIAAYWKKWRSIGLVEPSPIFKERFQWIVSLAEVNLEVPIIEVGSEEATEAGESG